MRFGAITHWSGVWMVAMAATVAIAGVEIRSEAVGINGHVRPGSWAPLLLTVRNTGSQPRHVICQWILDDHDGDEPHFQRRQVTLTPGVDHKIWLHAALPVSTSSRTKWRLVVIDASEQRRGEVLAAKTIQPNAPIELLDQRHRAIGVTGVKTLGLQAYDSNATQHEPTVLIRDVELANLPDRWFGLSMLQALIWTPRSDGPDAADMTGASEEALIEWTNRGGHLVIIMPSSTDPWFGSSLRQLMPPVAVATLADQTQLPPWIGPSTPTGYSGNFRTFERRATASRTEVSVLFADKFGRPLVVTSGYGFGRVTVVGIDLTHPLLARYPKVEQLASDGTEGFWGKIFSWRSPAAAHSTIERLRKQRVFVEDYARSHVDLGEFLPAQISMKRAAAGALVLAVLVFVLYWLAAGPVGFAFLKARRLEQHSWVVFVAVVACFTVLTWGGAMVLRPTQSNIEHFTVLDVDAASQQIRGHSWLALFMPRHRPVQLTVEAPGSIRNSNTLTGVGLLHRADQGRFLDPQAYTVAAGAPFKVNLPMRSTARQFEIDTLGTTQNLPDPIASWVMPNGHILQSQGGLKARLVHDVHAPLQHVLAIFCPGQGQLPRVWELAEWVPREVWSIQGTGDELVQLVEDPDPRQRPRYKWDGFLADLAFGNASSDLGSGATTPRALAAHVQALSLFDTLPPPNYRGRQGMIQSRRRSRSYERSLGRQIDLSHLLVLRRFIVIGLIQDAPLPLPLKADGKTIASNGWIVLRWIYPVP